MSGTERGRWGGGSEGRAGKSVYLKQKKKKKSFSARSPLEHGHPRQPRGSAFPAGPGSAPPLHHPSGALGARPSPSISARTKGSLLSEPFMNESRRSRQQGPRKVQSNPLLPPFPHNTGLFFKKKKLLFLTFSPPKPCTLRWSHELSARCGGALGLPHLGSAMNTNSAHRRGLCTKPGTGGLGTETPPKVRKASPSRFFTLAEPTCLTAKLLYGFSQLQQFGTLALLNILHIKRQLLSLWIKMLIEREDRSRYTTY